MKIIRVASFAAFILLLFCLGPGQSLPRDRVPLFFFWGEGCQHCARAKPFLEQLQKRYTRLEVRSLEVFGSPENLELLKEMARRHGTEARGVPMIFIGGRYFSGFSEEKGAQIEREVQRAMVSPAAESNTPPAQLREPRLSLPSIGAVDTSNLSLPVFTTVIALLDSFNPCAFFVLLFLLSLLVHAHSRRRMLVMGGIFVLFSALVYFLFMAAWLNFFLLFGRISTITVVAGVVAFVIALLNIKDFFFFKKGVSLGISEEAKPKLFDRMRKLLRTGSGTGMVAATIVLAVAANAYEVLCTAGFPMVYTRALTLQGLPVHLYYLYLLFYNAIYVMPLACIVLLFVVTLGSRKLSEWQGRVLKLLSGTMMLGLALVLLIRPSLLNNAMTSVGLLIATVVVTLVVAVVSRRFPMHRQES